MQSGRSGGGTPQGSNQAAVGDEVHPDDPTRTSSPATADEEFSSTRLSAPLRQRDRSRYDFVSEHGRGGLGKVFRARDNELGRDVAIKELLERTAASEIRFFGEALITARLEHPGIVPVHEAGRWSDGTPFYSMKLVAGRALNLLLAEHRSGDPRRSLIRNVAAVADAVAYAHDRRIIHRDLKPSNIIVGHYGETVVIDWGLAKHLGSPIDDSTPPTGAGSHETQSTGLTAIGTVLGTPAYMSPEQARGEKVDETTDVFSLGAILRELVAGSAADDISDSDIVAIIDRATATRPSDRYPSAREFARDLNAYLTGRRISARIYSLSAAIRHWIHHHRAIGVAVLAATLVVMATVAVSTLRIVRERDHAQDARIAADAQRKAAILAQATILLNSDPTEAYETLRNAGLEHIDEVLTAQIKAAGSADRAIHVGEGVIEISQLGSGNRYVAVTIDLALYLVDSKTGITTYIDRDLTNPPILRTWHDDIVYVTRDDNGEHLVVSIGGARPTVIAPVSGMPDLAIDNKSIYVLDEDGTVTRIDRQSTTSEAISSNGRDIELFANTLAICRRDGTLVAIKQGVSTPLGSGRCSRHASLVSNEAVLVVPADDTQLEIHSANGVRRVAFDVAVLPPKYRIANSGSIVASSRGSAGLLLPPRSERWDEVSLLGHPTALAAAGELAAWAFSSGTVTVRDLATQQTWSFKADDSDVVDLYVDALDRRVVVRAGDEIRIWDIPTALPVLVSQVSGGTFSAAVSRETGDMIVGSGLGFPQVITHDFTVRRLPERSGQVFAVAWCGEFACAEARDGVIQCTDHDNNTTIPVRVHGEVNWMMPLNGDCVYDDSNGNLGLVRAGRTLLHLPGDAGPARLDSTGRYLVFGDLQGNLFEYDLSTRSLVARQNGAHKGGVADVQWIADGVVSVGADHSITFWSRSLQKRKSIHVVGTPYRLAVAGDRLIAVTDRAHLYCLDHRGRVILDKDIHARASRIAVSKDAKTVAIATDRGEVILLHKNLGISIIRVSHAPVTFVVFASSHEMVTGTTSGEVARTNIDDNS